MSSNVYKIRKFEHFNRLLNIHNFKPVIAIFIKNENEQDKESYKNLKDTIYELSKVNVYILILLINTHDIEEFKELRGKNYIQMYYKTQLCPGSSEEISDDNLNIIISSKISDWNKKFIEDILVSKKKIIEPVENIEKVEQMQTQIQEHHTENEDLNDYASISSSNRLELAKLEKIQQDIQNLE